MKNYSELMKKFKTKDVTKAKKEKEEVNNDFLRINNDGKSVLVRFLPDIKFLERTKSDELSPYTRYIHTISTSDDDYRTFLCPTTNGGKTKDCACCSKAIEIWKNADKTPLMEALRKKMNRRCEHLVNVYVIDDEANPENNGKVKILKFYSEIWDKYEKAASGKLKDRIWRLDEEGCSLRIECKIKSDNNGNKIPSYASSAWEMPEEITGMTEEKMDELIKATFDITTLMPPVTKETIEGYYNEIVGESKVSRPKTNQQSENSDDHSSDSKKLDDMLENVGKTVTEETEEEPLPF